jgi:protein required for attachment to host cells
MATTWILVAHGSAAKILSVKKNGQEISLEKEFIHPQTAKKIPRVPQASATKSSIHHAMDYSGEYEAHERQAFARELIEHLNKALMKQEFNTLILVISRSLLGEIRKTLPHNLKDAIAHQLDKDLLPQNLSDFELVEKIRTDLGLAHL